MKFNKLKDSDLIFSWITVLATELRLPFRNSLRKDGSLSICTRLCYVRCPKIEFNVIAMPKFHSGQRWHRKDRSTCTSIASVVFGWSIPYNKWPRHIVSANRHYKLEAAKHRWATITAWGESSHMRCRLSSIVRLPSGRAVIAVTDANNRQYARYTLDTILRVFKFIFYSVWGVDIPSSIRCYSPNVRVSMKCGEMR